MNFDQIIAGRMTNKAREDLESEVSSLTPQESPILVILGGQPGSGKSNVIELITKRFKYNIIALNGDEFKSLYPNYKTINNQNPIKTAEIVQPYSNYLVNTIKQELANKKYNMIIEGTMRTVDVPMSTINEFINKGYKVEAYIVVANYYASRTGCLKRVEIDYISKGIGRAVDSKNHDIAYNNIPHTLSELLKSKKLDNMTAVSRGGIVLGQLAKGDDVLSVYTSFREQLKPVEYTQINSDLADVITMMQNRGANQHEINDVVALKDDFTNKYKHLIIDHTHSVNPINKENNFDM